MIKYGSYNKFEFKYSEQRIDEKTKQYLIEPDVKPGRFYILPRFKIEDLLLLFCTISENK